MIAACPKCAARYRIEREKIGAGGVRLRCSRCESVFRVRAPASSAGTEPRASAPPPKSASASASAPPPTSASASAPAATGRPAAGARPAASPSGGTDEIRVLVAMPDAELAKGIAERVSARGAPAAAVFDGVDAMLEIQRKEPRAVVLAADLPKMFGFQVCEVVKRNAALRDIRVVLAGAVHHPDRYRRSPSELYGADAFVETPDLPDALLPILEKFGLLGPAPAQAPGPAAPPRPKPAASESAASSPAHGAPPPSEPAATASAAGAAFEETRIDAPAARAPNLPPVGADPFQDAFGAEEPEAPAPPPAAEDSQPSLELDLDWAGSGPDAGRSLSDSQPPAASEGGGGGGVPLSLDFDFGDGAPDELPSPQASAPGSASAPPKPQAAAPEPARSPELDEQRAQAERLARIIVSDIVLYNEEKFAAAVEAGNVASALEAELEEGRGLFTQRIDERVRRESDFLMEELLRVARARGMK